MTKIEGWLYWASAPCSQMCCCFLEDSCVACNRSGRFFQGFRWWVFPSSSSGILDRSVATATIQAAVWDYQLCPSVSWLHGQIYTNLASFGITGWFFWYCQRDRKCHLFPTLDYLSATFIHVDGWCLCPSVLSKQLTSRSHLNFFHQLSFFGSPLSRFQSRNLSLILISSQATPKNSRNPAQDNL